MNESVFLTGLDQFAMFIYSMFINLVEGADQWK